MNFNSRLPRHHLQVAQTLRATGTLYILSLLFFERKDKSHHPMTSVPAPCSAEATGMPEEKHSTGTQKRDDLLTVALSLLMMPSPRSITSLPADRHLAGAPFRALAKLLEV